MWHSRPRPPFMANAILNFHFDYWNTSLTRFAAANMTRKLKRLGFIIFVIFKDNECGFFSLLVPRLRALLIYI